MEGRTSTVMQETPAAAAAASLGRGAAVGIAAGIAVAAVGLALNGWTGAGGATYWYYLAGPNEAPLLTTARAMAMGSALVVVPAAQRWTEWSSPASAACGLGARHHCEMSVRRHLQHVAPRSPRSGH